MARFWAFVRPDARDGRGPRLGDARGLGLGDRGDFRSFFRSPFSFREYEGLARRSGFGLWAGLDFFVLLSLR